MDVSKALDGDGCLEIFTMRKSGDDHLMYLCMQGPTSTMVIFWFLAMEASIKCGQRYYFFPEHYYEEVKDIN